MAGLLRAARMMRGGFSRSRRAAWLSTQAPAELPAPTSLTKEQALSSSRITLDFVRLGVSGRRLDALVAEGASPVQERWTKALQVLVAAQAHCASAFGYPATSDGVMLYRAHLSQSAQAAPPEALEELKALDQEVWAELLLRGFALAPKPLASDKARDFAGRVAAAASSADGALGDALSAKLAEIPADAPDRTQRVLVVVQGAMADVQMDLSRNLGYDGDDGYVQLQAALVEHMADPVVAHATTAATHALCARAGIAPPQ